MAELTIMQLNIKSWRLKNYFLKTELCNSNPDIILLNETSCTLNNITLKGYYVIQQCLRPFSGVALLVKHNLTFTTIPTLDTNTLAIKIHTSLGWLIVATNYTPPSMPDIPTLTLTKIFDYNLPVILLGDFNSHHPSFHNTYPSHPYGDSKGKQLASLVSTKKLTFLGPYFYTYKMPGQFGTPDLIFCNNQFRMFHYQIIEGNNVTSDHIPVILKISAKPFKKIISNKRNIKTLNIQNFKQSLESDLFENLDQQPVCKIDETVDKIFNNINNSINSNCSQNKIKVISTYKPTPEIKLKSRQIQAATNS